MKINLLTNKQPKIIKRRTEGNFYDFFELQNSTEEQQTILLSLDILISAMKHFR